MLLNAMHVHHFGLIVGLLDDHRCLCRRLRPEAPLGACHFSFNASRLASTGYDSRSDTHLVRISILDLDLGLLAGLELIGLMGSYPCVCAARLPVCYSCAPQMADDLP